MVVFFFFVKAILYILMEEENKEKDQRVYFGILQRVGLEGSYQTNFMRILYVISAISGATLNIVPFLFFQDPFDCGQFENDCTQTVCSLPAGLRSQYLPSKPFLKSLGNHYGDMHCERMEELTNFKELFLIGASVGVFVSILFVEIVGKKRVIGFALTMNVICIFGLIVLQNYYAKGISLFLLGGFSQIGFSVLTAYITEVISEQNRVHSYAMIKVYYVIGCLLNIAVFCLLRDWKMALLTYFLTFYAVSAVAFVYYVQSTPLELISNQTPQNAYKAFIRIADRNQVTDHGLTLQQIESLQQQYRLLKKKKHDYRFNFLDLLRYPSIRADFLKLGFMYFMILFLEHGYSFVLDELHMDIFMLSSINVASQFLVIPLFRFLLMSYPRRNTILISSSITTIFSFITFGLAPDDCFNCKSGLSFVFLLISYFFIRFFIHLSSNIFQGPLNESFPTQIRTIGIFSVVGIGRLSNIFLPLLLDLKNHHNVSLLLQFSVLGAFAIIGAVLLRQTLDILPEEIIEELKDGQNKSIND